MTHEANWNRVMATFDTDVTPLNAWVRDDLKKRYQPVLDEDLPRDWLRMLEQAPTD